MSGINIKAEVLSLAWKGSFWPKAEIGVATVMRIVLSILMAIGVLGYRVDQANRNTRLRALCDGLTGLANRRAFNETIEHEFQRALRNGRPLSLIMVDIDHFKTFNDQYGNPAGDACLRTISAELQGVLRRLGDMAARYGGEELAILLPETDCGRHPDCWTCRLPSAPSPSSTRLARSAS
jgi:GGDEF domain-containing protein